MVVLKMISIHVFIATTTALAALPSSLPLRPTGVITGAHVRYCYEGGTFRRDGRLLPLDDECTSGAQVLAALEADAATAEEPAAEEPEPEADPDDALAQAAAATKMQAIQRGKNARKK